MIPIVQIYLNDVKKNLFLRIFKILNDFMYVSMLYLKPDTDLRVLR